MPSRPTSSRRTGCRRRCSPTAEAAAGRGLQVIIAGAGGAAHLPGMLAAVTPLPVIGVPVPLKYLDGMDSLLSIVQMPAGVPVATVGGRQRPQRRPARRPHPRGVRRGAAAADGRVPGLAQGDRAGEGRGGPQRRRSPEARLLSQPSPRLVGLDVARCLALLGMVAAHVLDPRGPDGQLTWHAWLVDGRAAALFAVLAGSEPRAHVAGARTSSGWRSGRCWSR